jgi:predicted PurR-regulated permease PerM
MNRAGRVEGTGVPQRVVIEVRSRTILTVIAWVLVAVAAVSVLSRVREVLVWLAVSLFLAVALQPAVRLAERWLPHTLAVIAVFVALLLVIAAFLALLIVPIATQLDDLQAAAPGYIEKLRENRTIADLNSRYDVVGKAQDAARSAPGEAFGAASRVVSGAIATVTVLFLTLFLLLELPRLSEGVLSLLRPETAERVRRTAREVNRNVGGYVAGNLIISAVAGSVIAISLAILGVPYALALGLLMALFDLVPLVGATVGALAAIGVAFATEGLTAGIIMIVVNVVYQQVENHVLQPLIYRRTVQLSAFLVLVAVLAGAALLGVLGALVAIPVAGSIQLIVREILLERREQVAVASTS